jgi:hypothetical protein
MMSLNVNPVAPKVAPTVGGKKKPSPRLRRAIDAMMSCYPDGSIKREELDRICGSSNSPDIIRKLRKDYVDDEGVICQMVDCIDRDGRPCKGGQYSFSEAGFQRIHEQGLYHG